MNTQIKGNKSKLLTFAIAGEITVGTTSPEYLFSSVACLSENSTSKNKENISDLTKSVIAVGCIGVLIICLHFILCLRENICRSSDHIIV